MCENDIYNSTCSVAYNTVISCKVLCLVVFSSVENFNETQSWVGIMRGINKKLQVKMNEYCFLTSHQTFVLLLIILFCAAMCFDRILPVICALSIAGNTCLARNASVY